MDRFFTNTDKNIFALRNLPEVVKGALFSRYSRSPKGLREILRDEFIGELELPDRGESDDTIASQKAEEFYDRVLIGYGDDSVGELGGAHIACEAISNIAALAIEDSRLGISFLEKSTRYVAFDRKVDGKYQYYRNPSIAESGYLPMYETAMDILFDTYSELIEPVTNWVKTQHPQDENTSDRAYHSAAKAKALDLLRGLLPLGTLTNVGMFGNGRAFEYLLIKLMASPHPELNAIASEMQTELDKVIPSFVKRAKSDRGHQYVNYLRNIAESLASRQQLYTPEPSEPSVTLVDYDEDAEHKVLTAILYPLLMKSWDHALSESANISKDLAKKLLDDYIGDRQSRFHRPGRALEEAYYTFDIVSDIGAYRDLHRHRVCTQERQRFTIRHGYSIPKELDLAGVSDRYCYAMDNAAWTFVNIERELPTDAQYIVPFGFNVRWKLKLNLREAYHLIELRSSKQGHSSYRKIAQEIYKSILAVHPTLAAGIKFVDMNYYFFERLEAEQKLDLKNKNVINTKTNQRNDNIPKD